MKLLIIIPAYNEEQNIVTVIEDLKRKVPDYDYVIVTDGSKDGTAQVCREYGYNMIDLPINLGLSGAVSTGMRYADERGYDAVVQFDSDGQHQAEFLDKMKDFMEQEECDIVIGSRFVDTKKKPKTLRMFGSDIISLLIAITTGNRITDPTSGMRMYGREVYKQFIRDVNYIPEPDTICLLIKKGFKVKEVQVELKERISGQSYLNFLGSIKYMVKMSFSILFIQMFR